MAIKGTDQGLDCLHQTPALYLELQTAPCNQSVPQSFPDPGKMKSANASKVPPRRFTGGTVCGSVLLNTVEVEGPVF